MKIERRFSFVLTKRPIQAKSAFGREAYRWLLRKSECRAPRITVAGKCRPVAVDSVVMSQLLDLPRWLLVSLSFLLSAFIVYLTMRALREGREISFWPPRLGPKVDSGVTKPSMNVNEGYAPFELCEIQLTEEPIGALFVTSGPRIGLWIFVTARSRRITFGKGPGPERVDTQDPQMSRQHFLVAITPTDGADQRVRTLEVSLFDLNSSNGTYLNGKRLKASQHQHLKSGDIIEAGSSKVQFRAFPQTSSS